MDDKLSQKGHNVCMYVAKHLRDVYMHRDHAPLTMTMPERRAMVTTMLVLISSQEVRSPWKFTTCITVSFPSAAIVQFSRPIDVNTLSTEFPIINCTTANVPVERNKINNKQSNQSIN